MRGNVREDKALFGGPSEFNWIICHNKSRTIACSVKTFETEKGALNNLKSFIKRFKEESVEITETYRY